MISRVSFFSFSAAIDRWREHLYISRENALLQLSQRAIGCIGLAMLNGNVNASLAVLRGIGLLSGRKVVEGSVAAPTPQPQQGNNFVMEIQQAVVMNGPTPTAPEANTDSDSASNSSDHPSDAPVQ
jgi:hypothetical protein